MNMKKHYIIGTAGHIDHGKTTLAKALTGIDTDRLIEEKKRQISIELGFAPFRLPNGDQVSLIDVPGHEKFIRHMVAGVGGIDLVLLIIAADEGVMPQTKEHMQIIELLGIEHGIAVITKKDLVDQEFLMMVEEEVQAFLAKTILKDAPVISVSGTTLEGIESLKLLIQKQLSQIPERSSIGFFRLPIDRVFTLKGIGTVVTGTIYSGSVEVGQELAILPSNHKVRVRSLQVHSENVNKAYAGQRLAMNLTGVEVDDIQRGDSVVSPNQWNPSQRIDVALQILKDIDFSIKQDSEIKLHVGTSEVLGNLILYDRKEAMPGEQIYGQLKLDEPIITSRKERFIIRRPSPATTIGGGTIIEPNANKHKYRKETVEQLKQKSKGTLEDLILEQLMLPNQLFLTPLELSKLLVIPESRVKETLLKLTSIKRLTSFENGQLYTLTTTLDELMERITIHLNQYHQAYPLRLGQPKAEFTKKILPNMKPKYLQTIIGVLEQKQVIKLNDEYISTHDFQPSLPGKLEPKANQLEKTLIQQGFTPEDWDQLIEMLGISHQDKTELFSFWLNQGKILKLTDKLVIHQQTFEKLKQMITEFISKEGKITLQQAKEILQVSRKYLVPLMELLDRQKITVLKEGNNYRVLKNKSEQMI